MSDKFDRLVSLLRELFQLDQPDLDFGLYRIMHAKSGEVTQFLEKDLLPQVKKAFEQYQPADKAAIKKKLDQAVAAAESLGVDPDTNEKVLQLRAELAEGADLEALENEVYDHLFSFFRRYYSEGDFLAKRVYKPGVYAVPYEGEEVVLHWANKDQYYIKTSEYLRDYAFRLKPDAGDAGGDPMRVHFRLIAAAEGEQGNNKAAEGKDRVFVLAPAGESGHDFLSVETIDGREELVVGFEYRPATMDDWIEEAKAKVTAKQGEKPPVQSILINIAVKAVLAVRGDAFDGWIRELEKPHTKVNGETADYSRLAGHLNRYCARHTFDYFIHKDLGGFLRRELDFYIKNEVMHLDDVQNEDAPKVEQYLSKIKVIRTIAGKVINFLHQLEEFQRKLWLKKKFVLGTQYCLTVNLIPEHLYDAVVSNEQQVAEWEQLLGLSQLESDVLHSAPFGQPLDVAFLRQNPGLMVDTRYFDAEWTAELLNSLSGIDDMIDGVLLNGENLQALRLLEARYASNISCIYADPPYNTGDDDHFPYKDNYQHSTWLSMCHDRFSTMRALLRDTGVLFASIGLNEHSHLHRLLIDVFGESNSIAELVWEKGRKNDNRRFSVGHDYILAFAKRLASVEELVPPWREPKPGVAEVITEYRKLRAAHGNDHDAVSEGLAQFYRSLPGDHPSKKYQRSKWADSRGIWRDNNISWPKGGGPRYDVLHPVTKKPCAVPRDGWRFIEDTMKDKIRDGFVVFREDHTQSPILKSYLYIDGGDIDDDTGQPQVMGSVFYRHSQPSNDWHKGLFGEKVFPNPKDHEILARLIGYVCSDWDLVADVFAGSGSTADAALHLARASGKKLRYILAEVGEAFDTLILPRIKKVVYSGDWQDGRSLSRSQPLSHAIKYVRLESYEDALRNLELERTADHESVFASPDAVGLAEQYMLQYMLDVESRGSMSLLNIQAFLDPIAYSMRVKTPGSDDSREITIDLLETFNWLLGLRVAGIAAPKSFSATFERDSEGRLAVKGRIKEDPDSPWWFRTVTGTTPDGKRALIIWRKRPGGDEPEGIERDNAVLDAWFRTQGYSTTDSEFDIVWVNGDNNLANLRQDEAPDDGLGETGWKVRIIEQDFHRLMFDTSDVPGGE